MKRNMAPVTRQDVVAAFLSTGHTLLDGNASSATVTTCLGICRQYGLTAREFVDNWESYSLNNPQSGGGGGGNGGGGGGGGDGGGGADAELTKAALDGMAAQLSKRKNIVTGGQAARNSPSVVVTPRVMENRSLLSRDTLVVSPSNGSPAGASGVHSSSSPGYTSTDSKGAKDLSPISVQTPPDEIEGTYNTRTNAGQRVVEYNPNRLTLATGKLAAEGGMTKVFCRITPVAEVGVSEPYRFMFTPLEERAKSLERHLACLRDDMVKEFKLNEEGITPVGVPIQGEVNVVGRICCEAAEGKINRMSVILEGGKRDRGLRVHLSLKEMKQFALFPGQIIAARGINSSGTTMVVKGLIEGVPRPLPSSSPIELMRLQHSTEAGMAAGMPLNILVACGPFTISEDLTYQPLMDLLEVVHKSRPDVVVLAGPFVDEAHPKIASAEAKLEVDDGSEEYVDFETLFKYRVAGKLESFFDRTPDSPTQFILVPSMKDAFTECVYPQAPLHDRVTGGVKVNLGGFEDTMFTLDIPRTEGSRKRVHLLSNPCMFKINEVVVGMTSSDILFDLTNEEVSVIAGNRIPRLTEHLLQQQSFYPLFPPPANSNAGLDLRHLSKWRMPVTPDILLVPSRLTYFARNIGGCLCINPGQLARGRHGGTFATVTIHPMPEEKLKLKIDEAASSPDSSGGGHANSGGGGGGGGGSGDSDEDARIRHHVAERSAVQVLRI